jgi:hypothetical protein
MWGGGSFQLLFFCIDYQCLFKISLLLLLHPWFVGLVFLWFPRHLAYFTRIFLTFFHNLLLIGLIHLLCLLILMLYFQLALFCLPAFHLDFYLEYWVVYCRLVIFQGFYIFIDFYFHILGSLLNFTNLFIFSLSSFNCLFTSSLRSNTRFCISSLRSLILFTILKNSLFRVSSSMQVFRSLVAQLTFEGRLLSCCFLLHWDLCFWSCFGLGF